MMNSDCPGKVGEFLVVMDNSDCSGRVGEFVVVADNSYCTLGGRESS